MASDADRLRVVRLLRRFGFGPADGDLQTALEIGPTNTRAAILSQVSPDAAAKDLATTPPPQLPFVDEVALGSTAAANTLRAQQQTAMTVWWLDRMVTTSQPLLERMTWFWHGHWATSNVKVRDARFMLGQNQTQRNAALGPFAVLAKQMLRDPALLLWLDGFGSRRGHPNENLGREFLELFSLGVGSYSEADVRDAARPLTGWRLDRPSGVASLRLADFDPGPETILGTTASLTVDSFVDLVASRPACPAFIATRAWRHFMADEDPDAPALAGAVTALTASVDSTQLVPHFADLLLTDATPRPLAMSPVLWLVAVLRALGLSLGALAPSVQSAVLADLAAMGQVPFLPPNVSGWPSGPAWFTPTSAQARFRVASRLVALADTTTLQALSSWLRGAYLADLLGVTAWSDATASAISDAANSARESFVIAVNSPDYLVGV